MLFRVRLGGTFEQLLQQLRHVVLGGFQHASVPYALLLEQAELEPAAIPAMFVLQDMKRMDL